MIKLSDKVIAALQRDIAKGKYTVGDKIPPEPELMALYKVGRSTIREAVKTLSIAGILRVQQGDGTYVNEKMKQETLDERLRRADAVEINEVRALLEQEIVRLAALHRTPDDLLTMQQWLEQRKQAITLKQAKECADADIGFHMAVAAASQNQVLTDLYESFTGVIREFFVKRDATTVKWFAASHSRHEALFQAISSHQPKRAVTIIKEILQNNN